MMADFATWKPDNLARFAKEAQDKMIEQANQIAHLHQVLRRLMEDYEMRGELYCFTPDRQDAYRQAKEVFK